VSIPFLYRAKKALFWAKVSKVAFFTYNKCTLMKNTAVSILKLQSKSANFSATFWGQATSFLQMSN